MSMLIEDQSTIYQSHKSGAQEHLLGWALFFAWIDLTVFLARFDLFGRPIYLSWHVLSNVAWSMIVYIPTVVAFAAGFHCFLKRFRLLYHKMTFIQNHLDPKSVNVSTTIRKTSYPGLIGTMFATYFCCLLL